ncbi:rolling circle replication-associated protein [Georgenia satyanarayanai]
MPGGPRAPSVAGWVLSLYPDAAEASGAFVPSYRPVRDYVARGAAADPDRAAKKADGRARGRLRRYCAANRLNRLALTYGPPRCADPREVREHMGQFFRDLRAGLGGRPLPYAWVLELHKDGVHFHVHFAVGRFVPRRLINEAWGRGFVSIKLLGDLPVGSGTLDEARVAAR